MHLEIFDAESIAPKSAGDEDRSRSHLRCRWLNSVVQESVALHGMDLAAREVAKHYALQCFAWSSCCAFLLHLEGQVEEAHGLLPRFQQLLHWHPMPCRSSTSLNTSPLTVKTPWLSSASWTSFTRPSALKSMQGISPARLRLRSKKRHVPPRRPNSQRRLLRARAASNRHEELEKELENEYN